MAAVDRLVRITLWYELLILPRKSASIHIGDYKEHRYSLLLAVVCGFNEILDIQKRVVPDPEFIITAWKDDIGRHGALLLDMLLKLILLLVGTLDPVP